MAQADYNIANADGATVRADINDQLEAIATNNSGATAPADTFPHMWWFDASTNLLKQRNSANTDWVTVASKAAGVWIPYRDGLALPAWGTSANNLVQLDGDGKLPAGLVEGAGQGQCRLVRTDATTLTLLPFNGRSLVIEEGTETLPSAGVTLDTSGLSSDTRYFIYAFMDSGVMTLEASTTVYATHTDGTRIKDGDATRALVGMVRTDGSTEFVDTLTQRFVRSWFNEPGIVAYHNPSTTIGLTASGEAEWSLGPTVEVITWADEVVVAACGYTHLVSPGNIGHVWLRPGRNGTAFGPQNGFSTGTDSNYGNPQARAAHAPSEGYGYYRIFVTMAGGGTSTSQANSAHIGIETRRRAL